MRARAVTFALLTPALAGVLLFSVELANASRVIYGVSLGGEPVGGIGQNALRPALQKRLAQFLDTPLTLSGDGVTAMHTPRELGVRIDTDATFAEVWERGRSGALLADVGAQMAAIVSGTTLTPVVSIDEAAFAETTNATFRIIDQPARDAALQWNTKVNALVRTPEQGGRVIDRANIRASLLEAAAQLETPSNIPLRHVNDIPQLTLADLEDPEQKAAEILRRAPLTLKAGEVTRQIPKIQVGLWLTTKPVTDQSGKTRAALILNPDTVRPALERDLVPRVNRDPVDARFRVENGRVVAFALARDGQKLDVETARMVLEQELLEGSAKEITLPITITPAQIGNNAGEELGIRELLAAGETDFKGSPKNRVHNITVGTARYNGLLIKPGEEFSFNAILGPVGPETGYKPELVIKQNKTVPEYGGGLCQVSTTAFRAAVYAGLPITERRNHAYVVRYYGTPGFDATIYPPHPDFRFVNDTGHHILVQTTIAGTKLRFEFYGTADGRKVELIGPRVYDQKADGSAKTTLTMRVQQADGTMREQTFRSSYKSAALYPISRRNPLE